MRFGLTLLGEAVGWERDLIGALRERGLEWAGVHCRLDRVTDGWRLDRLLYDRTGLACIGPAHPRTLGEALEPQVGSIRRLYLTLPTPTHVKRGREALASPSELSERFFEQCLVRAMRIHDFVCRKDGPRLPRIELPKLDWRLRASRLLFYRLERRSLAQDRTMPLEGLVGRLEFEGDLEPVLPLVRACEVLHVGQKATFGMGRITAHFE